MLVLVVLCVSAVKSAVKFSIFFSGGNDIILFLKIHTKILILIILFALIVRVGSGIILWDDYPRGDAADYDNIALNIISGHGFISTRMNLYSYRPPLYPIFLALLYYPGLPNYLTVILVQSLLSALTCGLVYLIAKAIYRPTTALIAAGLAALYPGLIFYSTQLLSETLFIFLLYSAAAIFYRARNQMGKWIIIGMTLGLASLCRPIALPLTILLLPFFAWNLTHGIRRWLLVFFCALLLILPWTGRNYHIHHHPVLLTTYGGANLWLGNYPGANGHIGTPEGIQTLLRRKDISEPEKDSLCYRKALSFISRHPGQFMELSGKRFLLFWNPIPEEQFGPNRLQGRDTLYRIVVAVSFSILLLLAGLGAAVTPRLWKRAWLLLVLIFYFPAILMFYYISLRYRLPIIPALAILGGEGLRAITSRNFRTRDD